MYQPRISAKMDHLEDEYGPIGVPVPRVTERTHCEPMQSLDAFYAFPSRKGWSVGEGYILNETPESVVDRPALLQSWLFFGLISLVVQAAEGPILQFEDLLDKHNSSFLNTKKLSTALATWERYELDNEETAKVRMVRTELALEYAQRVVRNNCVFEAEESEATQSTATDVAEDEDTVPALEDDYVPLALMVLGETLSAAKARILQSLKSKMRGWHREEEGGWGPPRYVFREMEKRMWCPRTVYLLQSQLGSNATLLLAALESQDNNPINDIHRRSSCTINTCNVISGDEAAKEPLGIGVSQDEFGSAYRTQHAKGCQNNRKCTLIGPDMREVYEILREQSDSNEKDGFPILEIIEKSDKSLEFKVKPWSSDKSIKFATISHVWSDGLGNEDSNKIYSCQAKFISILLAKVVRLDTPGETELRTNAMPFWMDTLVIPVRKKAPLAIAEDWTGPEQNPEVLIPEDFDDLKKRAIRQIHAVFKASAHSIIIDKGLLDLDAKGFPWKNVMKILASGWMRRLWTLQEAYLSERLWITFKQHSGQYHDAMEDFDGLVGKIDKEKVNSSFTEMAKFKLLQNIMGDERGKWKRGGDPKDSGSALYIANTWRAARWRVSHSFKLEKTTFAVQC